MKTIWKYEIKIQDDLTLELPVNYKILHFGSQHGRYYIWVLKYGPTKDTMKINFKIVGTGFKINFSTNIYIGTAMDGAFVWHLFQVN